MTPTFRTTAPTLLALCIALGPAVTRAEVNDAEAQKLAQARKAERYNLALAGASTSIKAGGAMIYVNAPMTTVEKVVTDYGHYADFMPRFQKSRIVSKTNGTTDVYLQVPILHGAATVWAQTRFSPPSKEGDRGERIEGKMVQGNVDDLRAVWHLRPVDEQHTVLKLELLIVPKLPLPGSVVTPELEFAADQAVTSSRDRAELKAKTSNKEESAEK